MAGIVPVLTAISAVGTAAMTAASAQQQAGAQRIQAGQARLAAAAAEIAAAGEEVRGQSAALDLRQQLLRTLAAQNARWASAGVALQSGTPQQLADATAAEAERQLGIIETQTRINAAAKRIGGAGAIINAGLLEDQAAATSTAGWLGGAVRLAQGGINLFDRLEGTPTRPAARQPERLTGRNPGPI
jgi:hypothetical protein